jgi:hypothetical protein
MFRMTWGWICLSTFAFAIACAPEEPEAPVEATYAGRADDDRTFVAAIQSDTSFLVYACDDAYGAWFRAQSLVTPMELTNEAGDRLFLAIDEESAIGSLTRAGSEEALAFRLERTEAEVLFRADDAISGEPLVGGWIRLPDGEQRGVVTRGTVSTTSRITDGMITSGPFAGRLVPAVFTPRALQTPAAARPQRFDLYALGDSYGAGEGAPEVPGDYEADGDLREDGDREVWNASLGRAGEREARGCHRSGVSGVELAADLLEAQYGSSLDVRLKSYACSGATTEHLLSCPYRGAVGDHFSASDLQPPQIERLRADSAAAGVDAIYMSVGGNDMRFGYLMSACLGGGCGPGSGIEAEFLEAVARMRDRYGLVGDALDEFVLRDAVYISEYPNPVIDEDGDPCDEIDIFKFRIAGQRIGVIDSTDVEWISETVHRTLNNTVSSAVFAESWTPIRAHVETFVGHGYCTDDPWFHDNPSSLRTQGHHMSDSLADCDFPLDECIFPEENEEDACTHGLAAFSTVGGSIVHPTHAGYAEGYAPAIADALRRRVESQLVPPQVANLRIQNQAREGGVALAWDDRATTETEYRVRIVYDEGSVGAPADRTDDIVLPRDSQTFEIPLSSRASGSASVTTCVVGPRPERREVCSRARGIRWTNFPPRVEPAGGRLDTTQPAPIPVADFGEVTPHRLVRVTWDASSENGVVFYDVELTNIDGSVQRLATLQPALVATAQLASAVVRACNFTGCSPPGNEIRGPSCSAGQVVDGDRRCVGANLPPELRPRPVRR